MRIISMIAALVACVFSQAAFAQSTPGLTFGKTPTPAQWNSYFAGKVDLSIYTALVGSLGTGAYASVGTSGATLCLLNANCTVSGNWTFSGSVSFPAQSITSSELASGAAATNIGAGGVSASMLASGAAASNISNGSATVLNLPSPGTWDGSQMNIYGSPYGWGNPASVLCIQAFVASGTPCPVTGGVQTNPNGYATYTERDAVNFLPTIWGPSAHFTQTSAQIISQQAGTFASNSFTPTTPFTSGQRALLANQQQLKSSDNCTATLYNWKTDGSVLYTYGWLCNGAPGTPAGISAEVDADPAKLAGSWASATKFVFTTPLTSGQIADLRAGMPLDTDDATICSGVLTDWDAVGGTYVNASGGFFAQTAGGACTPSGAHVAVGDMTKIYAENPAMYLRSSSRAVQMANEYDCVNYQAPRLWGTSNLALPANGNRWCLDVVSGGNFGVEYGVLVRNKIGMAAGEVGFINEIELQGGAGNAAVDINPVDGQSVGVAFLSHGADSGSNTISEAFRDQSSTTGIVYASIPSHSGQIKLGAESGSVSTSPGLLFYPNGDGIIDASLTASGGSGASGTATIQSRGNHTVWPGIDGISLRVKNAANNADAFLVDSSNHYVTAANDIQNGVRLWGANTGAAPQIAPACGDATCALIVRSSGANSVLLRPGADGTGAVKIQTASGSTTLANYDTINNIETLSGNFYTTGTTPQAPTSCGTSPSVSGTDVSGKLTIGSGTVTACTFNFHATLPNAPHGVTLTPANATAAAQATTGMYLNTISTTGFTLAGTALQGAVYTYHVE